MNRFFEIIKYSWKAKGRHGIHSPFVYDLVDKCFEIAISKNELRTVASQIGTNANSIKLLTQLTKHLSCKHISTNLKERQILQSFLQQQHIQVEVESLNFSKERELESESRLIFMDCSLWSKSLNHNILELIPTLDVDTIIVLSGIRTKHFSINAWKTLVSHSSFHFTADLYQLGLLSRRTFQEKEHFILRY